MVKNVRIIKKQANAEILARIIKAASRKYDCSMKIDFKDGNRVAEFIGPAEFKPCIAKEVESIFRGDKENISASKPGNDPEK